MKTLRLSIMAIAIMTIPAITWAADHSTLTVWLKNTLDVPITIEYIPSPGLARDAQTVELPANDTVEVIIENPEISNPGYRVAWGLSVISASTADANSRYPLSRDKDILQCNALAYGNSNKYLLTGLYRLSFDQEGNKIFCSRSIA